MLPPPPFSLAISLGRRAQGDRNKPNGTTKALLEGVEAAGHGVGVGVAQAGGGWVGAWRAGTEAQAEEGRPQSSLLPRFLHPAGSGAQKRSLGRAWARQDAIGSRQGPTEDRQTHRWKGRWAGGC